MPTVIVGTHVDDKPTFITISYRGIVHHVPPMVSITLINSHYTTEGIKANKAFSINIPNTRMLKITDFIGMNSGKSYDKSGLFDIFYGKLKTAPMITETPLNLECKLIKTINLDGSSEVFISEIIESYSEKPYLKKRNHTLKSSIP